MSAATNGVVHVYVKVGTSDTNDHVAAVGTHVWLLNPDWEGTDQEFWIVADVAEGVPAIAKLLLPRAAKRLSSSRG